MTRKQKSTIFRIGAAALLLVLAKCLPADPIVKLLLFFGAYFVIGYDILWDACRGIFYGRVCDENFLMAVATVGAIALAFYDGTGDLSEAVAVMLFYQIGEWFQDYALDKSRKNIASLMDIRPDYANIEKDGTLMQVDPEEVEIGSIIVVQPGEKIPIDGVITEGTSALNTGALTGESLPKDVAPGDAVISGCINLSGLLHIRTTKAFSDSTVCKILELVEESGNHKSRPEHFISRFARIYTPAVCLAALALGILPPVISLLAMMDPMWHIWLYRALTFLVISCPCALVVSIPLTFFAGIGGASKAGILVKGSNYLEALSQANTVVFDKTGTLTQGVFQVSRIWDNEMEEGALLELAAHAECASSHPISKSLQAAWGKAIDRSRVTDIQEFSGEGTAALVDEKTVAVGNLRLMDRLGIPCPRETATGTLLYVAVDGIYAGRILISDTVKPEAKQALQQLKKAGIQRTVMLTGDTKATAAAIGKELDIDEVKAQLLPGDKVHQLEQLFPQKGKLLFAGDGINDAPVLTRADVGVAMGALGSDAAIEAADIVLMDDDLRKLPKAITIAKKSMTIVRQNILFALGIKFGCLILGALGIANMWFAIFADVGVMVLCVLNAIRALRA